LSEGGASDENGVALSGLRLQGRYNGWFNQRLAETLKAGAGRLDQPAGLQAAVMRQLNHAYVMDWLWLGRFAQAFAALGRFAPGLLHLPPAHEDMEAAVFDTVQAWSGARGQMDSRLQAFVAGLAAEDLTIRVDFVTLAEGQPLQRPLWALLTHLFNHQSLHRGEVIALMGLVGLSMGATDILPLTEEADPRPPRPRAAPTAGRPDRRPLDAGAAYPPIGTGTLIGD
jgi:uncharacterized damage-inducible protein DinB